MVFHHLFLLMLFASLNIVRIHGQKENDDDSTKLFTYQVEALKIKEESNKHVGCPFANLASHKTFKSLRSRNDQYQRALQLERMSRTIQNKDLEKEDARHNHTIQKRHIFPFFTSRRRFPFRANNRHRKIYRNNGRIYSTRRVSTPLSRLRFNNRVISTVRPRSRHRISPTISSQEGNSNLLNGGSDKDKSSIDDTTEITNLSHAVKTEGKQRLETNEELGGEDNETITKIDQKNESDNFECPLEKMESITNCQQTHRYRSFSGICNNLDTNKNFGKHSSILKRLLPSEYEDGISHPRKMSKEQGIALPNPRYISSVVHQDKSSLDYRYTLALMQWGQFLDHDITLTPVIDALAECHQDCQENDSSFDNTNQNVVIGPCYSIPVPKGDKYFPEIDQETHSKRCLPVIRSLPAQKYLGPRDQMNAITAYIDASNLYGSDPCMNQQLREKVGGKMKVLKHPMSPNVFKPLMPRHAHHPECKSPTGKCFMTGDDRNSEQPGLVSMHTIMMREHNRIAEKLELLNPHWSDDNIFQEARKIIIAINQHITYNEFLPRVLGPDLMRHFDLQLEASKSNERRYNGYDGTCSADIHNEFATAAYRFGHSLIRPGFDLMPEPNTTARHLPSHILLRNHFFQPDVTFGVHTVDKLLRGMVNMPMESFDRSVSNEVTQHLFEEQGKAFSGQDLAALNIQRGREHGIPGYIKYLNLCSKMLSKDDTEDQMFKTFDDLNLVMNSEASSLLSAVYNNVEDIDLFTGGLSESPLPGALVGPTFGCIIGLQFQNLRKCDRFWYENSNANIGFTKEQLKEIQKVTLASILCRNWDVTSPIQKWAFDMQDPKKNPIQSCSLEYHPTINMSSAWRDNLSPSIGRSKLSSSSTTSCDIAGRIVKPGNEVRVSACSICSCSFPEGETECYSDVVKSCEDLVQEFGRSAVAVDIACKAQCPEIVKQADQILSAPPLVPV